MATRSRAELKGFFKKNAIPTQSNFEDLIDGGLNQNDDGVVRLPNDALTINAAGPEQALLRFSNVDASGSTPAWLIKQNPTGAAAAGLVFQDAGNIANSLFIESGSGNVGVGTLAPGAKLDVQGGGGDTIDLNVNGRLRSNNDDGGLWISNDRFVGGAAGLVGFAGNGNNWWLAVQTSGNVGIGTTKPSAKLEVAGNLKVTGAPITPSVGNNANSGLLWPTDPGGGSGDAAWLRYYPRGVDSCTLEIGISNDADDHLFLNPSGNVGIGTLTPTAKLDVAGHGGSSIDLHVNGRLCSDSNDGGLWISTDRFVGGFDTDKIGFYNASVGWQLMMQRNGNVGIGTQTATAKLQVNGDIAASGKLMVGSWSLETDGVHLFVKHGIFTVARFSSTGTDRFNVFANANGVAPFFFYNVSQGFNTWNVTPGATPG